MRYIRKTEATGLLAKVMKVMLVGLGSSIKGVSVRYWLKWTKPETGSGRRSVPFRDRRSEMPAKFSSGDAQA